MPPVIPRAIRAMCIGDGGAGRARGAASHPPYLPNPPYSPSSIFSTLRRSTSRCAMAIFLPPASRGSAPASSCRARLPAMTTNSNRFSFGARSMKCSYDGFRRSAHQPDARPLRDDDRLQPLHRCRHFVVDHHVLVLRVLRDLAARDVEPPANLLLTVLAPPAKPLLQHRRRWRQHENADRLDAPGAHLTRALHVDDEHDVLAAREERLGVVGARSVVVAEYVGPLEKRAVADHLLEAIARNEIIVNAGPLARSGAPRRIGPRHVQVGHLVHQALDQGGFAGPRWGRDDEQQAAPRRPTATRHSGPAPASSRVRPWR